MNKSMLASESLMWRFSRENSDEIPKTELHMRILCCNGQDLRRTHREKSIIFPVIFVVETQVRTASSFPASLIAPWWQEEMVGYEVDLMIPVAKLILSGEEMK